MFNTLMMICSGIGIGLVIWGIETLWHRTESLWLHITQTALLSLLAVIIIGIMSEHIRRIILFFRCRK
jgi:hypothetical protein